MCVCTRFTFVSLATIGVCVFCAVTSVAALFIYGGKEMKNGSFKKLVGILCLLLVIVFVVTGCSSSNHSSQSIASIQNTSSNEEILPDQDGNPYSTHKIVNGETIVEYDYSDAYEKLDLSQYTEHGEFGDDGIMWVKKSDYTGTQYGYINFKGDYIVRLTGNIKELGEFKYGYATMIFNDLKCVFIDTKGNKIYEYSLPTQFIGTEHLTYINNNVFLFDNITTANKKVIFLTESNKFVDVSDGSVLDETKISVSDNMLRVPKYRSASKWYIEYYNLDGDLELCIDKNSHEYYDEIIFTSDFQNGVASVKFKGLDNSYYMVNIDRKGVWQNEPEKLTSKPDGFKFW